MCNIANIALAIGSVCVNIEHAEEHIERKLYQKVSLFKIAPFFYTLGLSSFSLLAEFDYNFKLTD